MKIEQSLLKLQDEYMLRIRNSCYPEFSSRLLSSSILNTSMSPSNISPGELDLHTLVASLDPSLHPDMFVFVTLPRQQAPPPSLYQQMMFREKEGLTVITTQSSAKEHALESTFPCRMVTLNVHSSLEAVGFMAAVTNRLTALKTGANPVSGYFHDHLFVPVGKEAGVLEVLKAMAIEAKQALERRSPNP